MWEKKKALYPFLPKYDFKSDCISLCKARVAAKHSAPTNASGSGTIFPLAYSNIILTVAPLIKPYNFILFKCIILLWFGYVLSPKV